ncbi:MAG: KpsF/GutQ family sugar-phosphate isomerase [Geminicoccaceae bacterium]
MRDHRALLSRRRADILTRERDPSADERALASARRVLRTEAEALAALERSIGESFAAAVDLLAGIEGRVVVTGMGKSGHVARKIAATLASTGTPALFVHPAEASHGDLGMITTDDAVLALSNSGETSELKDLTLYTRRFAIPLVAVVGRAPSTLAEAADLAIVLPELAEACPMGLAPTTSTTCMLALGDALAVALLERSGFSARQFAVFHPGGKLGAQLLRVEQIMRRGEQLPLVPLDASARETVLEMTRGCLGCVGVVDGDGKLVGIVTDGDLRRHLTDDLLAQRARDIMTPNPRTIEGRALAVEAMALMNDPSRPITVLFITEEGRPVGALHLHDCLRAGIA